LEFFLNFEVLSVSLSTEIKVPSRSLRNKKWMVSNFSPPPVS
jgi:hypothetical protein